MKKLIDQIVKTKLVHDSSSLCVRAIILFMFIFYKRAIILIDLSRPSII